MKQVEQNYRSGELKVVEAPVPRLNDGAVLVETRVSLISSGTEKQLMEIAKASLAGKAFARPDLVRRVIRNVQRDGLRPTMEKVFAKLDTPIPLGYSLAGEVIEIGRGLNGFSVGDRIACAGSGLANHAEFNAIPKNLIVRIPDGVSDEDASFVTLGAIALQGVRQAAPTLGEKIVVLGLGLIGLLTVQLLKANGCQVLGFDPDSERAKLAKELGADVALSDGLAAAVLGFTNGHGADAVILAASTKSNEPINTAAEISRLKGRVVIVGLVGMALDREGFYKKELDLKLSMSYGPGRHDPSYEIAGHDYPLPYVRWTQQRNMEAFLALVADGRVTPARLVTHRFVITDAEQAYGIMERGEQHLAMLLTYAKTNPQSFACRIERTPQQQQATCDPSAVAFIGFGNYAKGVLLPALRKVGGIKFATVVTSTGLSARHASEKIGFAIMATEATTAFDDPSVGTVFIVTRHNTHADLVVAALKAGKHVFCEKPLALNDAELNEVLVAAVASERVLTVGFNRRYAPSLVAAKGALEPRSGPLVMIYRINAGAIPADSWVQRDEGGGRIVGEVCHFIDALTYLCGHMPIEVSAISARGHEDAVSILIKFADGSTGAIIYSSLGDAAMAKEYIEIFSAGIVVQLDDFCSLSITRGGKRKVQKSSQDKGQSALIVAFMDAVRCGNKLPIPLQELEAVTRATFAIEESLRTGAVVAFSSDR